MTVVHGSARDKALASWKQNGGVAVTTFETTAHFELEDDFTVNLTVVDEAHYIKNAEARRSVNVKKLCARSERLLFMTGTAIENRVNEMVALIEVLQPAVAAEVKGMAFMSSAPQFREAVSPVYYRRKREDVLTEGDRVFLLPRHHQQNHRHARRTLCGTDHRLRPAAAPSGNDRRVR